MERPMTEWNDDRLDELNRRVDNGFAKVDQRFIRLEGEMKVGFARVDKQFEKADERFATREEMGEVKVQLNRLSDRFDKFDARLDRVLNTLLAAALGFGGTVLVAALGLMASQL